MDERIKQLEIENKRLSRELKTAREASEHAESAFGARCAKLEAIIAEKTRREGYTDVLLRNSPLPIIMLDAGLTVTHCSRSACRTLGMKEGHVVGKSFRDLMGFTDDAGFVSRVLGYTEKLSAADETISVEERVNTAFGSRYLRIQMTLAAADGEPGGCVVFVTDNTEREIMSRAAAEAAESGNRFIAGISHEIRTPMNSIIGMSELMRTDNFDEAQKRYFEAIRLTSKSLMRVINDILDYSEAETGRMELHPSHFNLHKAIDDVCASASRGASEKGLAFKRRREPGVPEYMYGDEKRLRRAMSSLLDNAVKYTREGKVSISVKLEKRSAANRLLITVADTGIGIHDEDRGAVFTAFGQGKDKDKRVMGTGLGLLITKHITELMRGRIWFESEYGRGTTFCVEIPFAEGDAALAGSGGEELWVTAKPETRVLVVDDNTVNLAVASGFLANHGIRAESAESGETAVEKARRVRYDMIFMDHMMPGMNGVEAMKLIRELPGGNCPIVAFTANVTAGASDMFITSGFDDFLPKPIEPAPFNAALSRWLPEPRIASRERRKRGGGQS